MSAGSLSTQGYAVRDVHLPMLVRQTLASLREVAFLGLQTTQVPATIEV
jgi:hypothetical protein